MLQITHLNFSINNHIFVLSIFPIYLFIFHMFTVTVVHTILMTFYMKKENVQRAMKSLKLTRNFNRFSTTSFVFSCLSRKRKKWDCDKTIENSDLFTYIPESSGILLHCEMGSKKLQKNWEHILAKIIFNHVICNII